MKEMSFERLVIYKPGFLDRGDLSRFGEKIGRMVVSSIPVALGEPPRMMMLN